MAVFWFGWQVFQFLWCVLLWGHFQWFPRSKRKFEVTQEVTWEEFLPVASGDRASWWNHYSWELGGDSTGHQPAIFFFYCILTFSCDTCVTPPLTFAGGLLSNIERFHKAKSLQSADWVDSSFGMVENHTVGWMWAWYHDLYSKPSFQCLVLQVNRGSLQIGKNSPSIFLGEWQEVSSPECIWKIIDHLLLPKRCHPELTPFRNAKLSQIPKNFSQPSK